VKVEELCSGCAAGDPSKEHQSKLVTHGDPVRTESKLNKGHWLEISYTLKCPDCGAIWENSKAEPEVTVTSGTALTRPRRK